VAGDAGDLVTAAAGLRERDGRVLSEPMRDVLRRADLDEARLDLVGQPCLADGLAVTLASTAEPSPLTRPASLHARTTAANTNRNTSLPEAAMAIDRERRMVGCGAAITVRSRPEVAVATT
jgi:hypothetical protein